MRSMIFCRNRMRWWQLTLKAIFVLTVGIGSATGQPSGTASVTREAKVASDAFFRDPASPAWVDVIDTTNIKKIVAPVGLNVSDVHFYLGTTTTVYTHRAIQVNDAAMLSSIGQYGIYFQPDYQKLTLHRLRVIRGNQTIDKLASAEVRFLQRERELESGIYTGLINAVIVTDDVRVGDILDIAYSTVGENPVFGNQFFDAAYWDISYPVARRRITLNVPAGREVNYKMVGDALTSQITPKVTADGNRRLHRFEAKDLPASDVEPNVPGHVHSLRWLQLSEFKSWSDVNKWALKLFDAPVSDAAWTQLSAVTRGASSKKEMVSKALEFVQNDIRYLSISLGENSHRPFSPDTVLKRRYGDCKDKSLMLVTMLRKLGIQADPVLVSSGRKGGLEDMLPSPAFFDHAIVRVVLDGKTYFLDPTRLGQYGDIDRMGQVHAGVQVLVVAADTLNITRIPAAATADLITSKRFENVTMTDLSLPAQMGVRLHYVGVDAEGLRVALGGMSSAQIRKAYESLLSKRYPTAQMVEVPRLADDRKTNQFIVELTFSIPDFLEATKTHWTAQYLPFRASELFFAPENLNRVSPVVISAGRKFNHYEFDVTLPQDVVAKYKPEESSLDSPAFAYHETLSFVGNKIRAVVDLETKAEYIGAEQVKSYVSNLRKLSQLTNGSVLIRKTDLRAEPQVPFDVAIKNQLEDQIRGTTKTIDDSAILRKDAADSLCLRALAYAYLGRREAALADLQTAMGRQMSSPDFLKCSGYAKYVLGQFASSETDLSRAIALGLKDHTVFFRRGLSNLAQKRYVEAAFDFEQSKQKSTDPAEKGRATLWMLMAQQYASPQRNVSATEVDPAWEKLTTVALNVLLKREAPEKLLETARAEPGDRGEIAMVEAYFYTGQYYMLTGNRLRASAYFQKAVEKGAVHTLPHIAAQHALHALNQ
jgi:transglutaminase-like putative cysteine protease/tetratricopeptide (TPR) repeat protein